MSSEQTTTTTTAVENRGAHDQFHETDLIINSQEFCTVTQKLRTFFLDKNFVEVHTQNRLSILAACEDPKTIQTFNYAGQKWPLPQTGQMWLEYELLKDPTPPGYFCVSTSYRNEPNPVKGRHDIIFPMFEFEIKGDFNDLLELEEELCEYLGYGKKGEFAQGDYIDVAMKYGTKDIEHEQEQQIYKDEGAVFMLKNFPEYTSPFWNMKRWEQGGGSYKVDVIMSGMETIGSAERSCDPEQMRKDFYSISEGEYANLIFAHFGKERVEAELEDFFTNAFMKRSGGGIGLTRLIRSMKMENLI